MSVSPGHNVDLLYDRPAAAAAATDADLIFGADYVPPRNDVVVRATLPLPVASFLFIPPARLELLAELPGLTVSTLILRPSVPLHVGVASLPGVVLVGEVRYTSRTQRPTVGQTGHEWQQAAQTEDGAMLRQQDAFVAPAGWGAPWQRASVSAHGITHRLPPVLVAAPLQRRTGQQQATRLTKRDRISITRLEQIAAATSMTRNSLVALSTTVRHLICWPSAVVSKTKSYAHTALALKGV